MFWKNAGMGAFVGFLLTAPLTAILYLGNQLLGLPYLPFDLFDWMAQVLPGPVITFGIETMIDTMHLLGIDVADSAKTAENLIALAQFLAGGVLAGLIFYIILRARKVRSDSLVGLALAALYGLPQIAISLAIGLPQVSPVIAALWLGLLFIGWGEAYGWIYQRTELLHPRSEPAEAAEFRTVQALNRRQFLIVLGTSAAAITVAGAGLGAILARGERREDEAELADTDAHTTSDDTRPPFPNANDPVTPAPGTRPEYTPLKDHYQVFIRSEPTVIDGANWVLPITGMVDRPLMLTLIDLRTRYSRRDQFVTISCISGRVGTTLIGTTLWSGASMQEVLADAGVQERARYLYISSADGFYETVPLDLINADERIMFCYDWDGHALPEDHGFPLRIWLPDRFGMKQPKWITSVEVTDQYIEGFWVERGWDEVAQVRATSVIDTIAVDAIIDNAGQRRVPVGGIAFSGDRGISKVEVRVDGANAWEPAQLRTPLSETTWVFWRYEWPFAEGHHTFEVRCAEGDGTPQIEEPMDAHPSGATGIHQMDL
jgi:DMSO/TMAO reductase YedYZ molybdopterin-dependent catalytic subunit